MKTMKCSEVTDNPFLITFQGIAMSMICGASLGLGKCVFWDKIEVNNNDKRKRHEIIAESVIGGMGLNLGLYLIVPNAVRLLWLWPLVQP